MRGLIKNKMKKARPQASNLRRGVGYGVGFAEPLDEGTSRGVRPQRRALRENTGHFLTKCRHPGGLFRHVLRTTLAAEEEPADKTYSMNVFHCRQHCLHQRYCFLHLGLSIFVQNGDNVVENTCCVVRSPAPQDTCEYSHFNICGRLASKTSLESSGGPLMSSTLRGRPSSTGCRRPSTQRISAT